MKYLKLSCLVIGAAVVVGIGWPGSASATVLCTGTEFPCGSDYPSGTTIDAELETNFVIKTGWVTVECATGELEAATTNTGGSTSTVTAKIARLTLGNCKCGSSTAHATLKASGTLELHDINATDNGTTTGANTNLTFLCTGVGACNYGTAAAGTDLGTLFAGPEPELQFAATLPRIAEDGSVFTCGSSATVAAWWDVLAPRPLFVATS